jgi:catechol 2,3-dioxygenase-like lactoylglutathione lyase family enzyme
MILGLSHMGLTVSKLDSSLDYYRKNLGFTVLSDAERKGEWVEKITGIPGFHTRAVYLSLSPDRHFEVFGFFHPEVIPMERESRFRVGILGCVLKTDSIENLLVREDQEETRRWVSLLGREEGPFGGCRVIQVKDPDGLSLRIMGKKGRNDDESINHRRFAVPGFSSGKYGKLPLFLSGPAGFEPGLPGRKPFRKEREGG